MNNKNDYLMLIARLADISAKIESLKSVIFGAMRELIPKDMALFAYKSYWEFYSDTVKEALDHFQLSPHELETIHELLRQELDYAEKKKNDPYFDRPDLKFPMDN